jgi:replicative DNA helicase
MPEKPSFTERFIKGLKSASEYLPDIKEILLKRHEEPELSLTTLPLFNRKIWGIKRGLTVLGGRVSQGKSSLALQIAYDLASHDHNTLFLSLEMSTESLIERLFCNVMEIDNFEILTGKMALYENQWEEFIIKMAIPLHLACGIGKDFEEINQTLELLEPKPEVIILDYIQAIRNSGDERQNLNEYLRKFREICVENQIAGIVCSQISRKIFEEGNREPTLFNLKGSGALEELADTCLLLHWEHFYRESADENVAKIIIAKQRNGRTGEYLFHYKPQYYKFYDIVSDGKMIDKVKEVFDAKEVEAN